LTAFRGCLGMETNTEEIAFHGPQWSGNAAFQGNQSTGVGLTTADDKQKAAEMTKRGGRKRAFRPNWSHPSYVRMGEAKNKASPERVNHHPRGGW